MKWLIWFFVLLNGLLLGYFQLVDRHQQPQIERDIDASKIRIVTADELAVMPKQVKPVTATDAVAATSSSSVPPQPVCYEWGSFAAPDVVRAKAALDRLALEVTTIKHTPQEAIRYWVYIPPLKSPEAAQSKVDEIRQQGVEESFIIQEPQWRNAISLGVFRDETLANKMLEDLHTRGVKSAIKGIRNRNGEQTGYQIRNMTPAQQSELDRLKPDFPGIDLKQIECR